MEINSVAKLIKRAREKTNSLLLTATKTFNEKAPELRLAIQVEKCSKFGIRRQDLVHSNFDEPSPFEHKPLSSGPLKKAFALF
jgi:hypothetical protein